MSEPNHGFTKEAIKQWRRTLHREIDDMERVPGRRGRVAQGSDLRGPAMVMMTVAYFGTDPQTVSDLSGQPMAMVRAVLKRLRAQRILVGHTMRTRWHQPGAEGFVALVADALVAQGLVERPVDEKRSAALKGRAGRKSGTVVARRPRAVGVFTPKQQMCNPLYRIQREQEPRP